MDREEITDLKMKEMENLLQLYFIRIECGNMNRLLSLLDEIGMVHFKSDDRHYVAIKTVKEIFDIQKLIADEIGFYTMIITQDEIEDGKRMIKFCNFSTEQYREVYEW